MNRMDDSISRQAAINVADAVWSVTGDKNVAKVWDQIKDLPSAQPDNQVHLCDSCKYTYPECPSGSKDVIYGNGKGNDNICACNKYEPSAQPEPRWIPVTERLPEDDTLMLVNYIDSRPDAMDIWIGWHEMENVWYIDGEEHSRGRGNEVIAWMPLPESYRGANE